MKTNRIFFGTFFLLIGLWRTGYAQNTIQVKVQNLTARTGAVYAGLCHSAATFTHPESQTQEIIVPVTAKGEVFLTFPNVAPGTYAIRLYHDRNSNKKMDTNYMGFPKEPFGFSNNTRQTGPASFEEASFTVKSDIQLIIELRTIDSLTDFGLN